MKDEDLRELTARIRQEMEGIQRVLERMKEGWERARRSNDDYYLDGVAPNLHGFYSGVERIFAQIAETIDGQVPCGENWHQVLLQQMMDEVAHVRPAVISTEIGKRLNEHRGFRHIVRDAQTLVQLVHDRLFLPEIYHGRPVRFSACNSSLFRLDRFAFQV